MKHIGSRRSQSFASKMQTIDQVVRLFACAIVFVALPTVESSTSFRHGGYHLASSLAFQRSHLFRDNGVKTVDSRLRLVLPTHPLLKLKSQLKTTLRFPRTIPALASTLPLRGGTAAVSYQSLIASITSSKSKCWTLLFISILCETMATSLSKRSRDIGSTPLFVLAWSLYLLCMCGFNVTLSQISVGVAYSVWSALGVLVVTTMGIVFFNEKCSPAKLVCLALIIGGVVGLNLLDNQ